jgi:hypothetical protein
MAFISPVFGLYQTLVGLFAHLQLRLQISINHPSDEPDTFGYAVAVRLLR